MSTSGKRQPPKKDNGTEPELAALKKENRALKKRLREVEKQIASATKMRLEVERRLSELESRASEGQVDEEVGSPGATATETTDTLDEIRLRQSRGFIPSGDPLVPTEPFFVHTHLHLPVTPTPENMDIGVSTYAVKVVVSDAEGARQLSSNGFADDLSMGCSDYANVVKMPKLEPGAYTLSVVAMVPFARIGERKTMRVVVDSV